MMCMVGAVGIEPTLTALSRQCLRVYKARPKANISNTPIWSRIGVSIPSHWVEGPVATPAASCDKIVPSHKDSYPTVS